MSKLRRSAVFLTLAALVFGSAALLRPAGAAYVTPPVTLHAVTPQSAGVSIGVPFGFGFAAAAADVNHDGYDDVIVASPKADFGGHVDCGEVTVFRGPSLTDTIVIHQPTPEDNSYFGWSVTAADFNGDGYADVAVGSPYAAAGGHPAAGRIAVFFGPSLTTATVIDNPQPDDNAHFGSSVAVGNVNGDGKADLLVGAPDAPVGGMERAGKSFVFVAPSFSTSYALQALQPEANASFGRAVAAADVNNDGFDDVIVGAPNADADGEDTGLAFVFLSPSFGTVTTLHDPEPQPGAYFGQAVAGGDFNGDGYDDPLIGAYGSHWIYSGVGRAFVFTAPSLSSVTALEQPVVVADSAYFGYELTVADVNHDGYADAVIGAHDADLSNPLATAGGETDIFLGPSFQTVYHFQDPQAEPFAFFSRSIAVGDVNGDGQGDLITGAPGADVNGIVNAGEAFVFLGEPDSDGDGVPDSADNCPTVYNPDQTASGAGPRPAGPSIPSGKASNPANDPQGDACDHDLPPVIGPFTNATDTDGDGLPDSLEQKYGTCAFVGDPSVDYSSCAVPADSDGEGCSDMLEVLDINGDRKVAIGDQLLLARRAAGIVAPDPVSDLVFDINKDGKITVGDQLLMAKNTCTLKPNQIGCPVCPPE